jgi:hypothetical protein
MTTNFVFSSVGDNTSFDDLYIGNNMNYDIYVIYYANDDNIFNKYKSKVTFIEKRKGSKFQNFKYFYEKYPEIINKYDYFFILDDDIIIDVPRINEMFSIAKQYNLSICGPSFKSGSIISHAITKRRQNILLSYTNFVEVNVPLFNKKALTNLMKILDYSLIGWGIDMLYIWCNGLYKQNTYAIIHKIGCINPHPKNKKNKKRELYLLKNAHRRAQIWNTYAKKIKCPTRFIFKTYKSIKL